MKRMWKCFPIAFFLITLLLPQALAASSETAALVSQFRQSGALYVFTALEEWPDGLTAELSSGDLARNIPSEEQPQRVADSNTPVSYFLLIDCSTSMARFQNRITGLTRQLAQADETGATFAVATFGEVFRAAGSDLSGAEVAVAVEAISCIAQRTDLSQGILDAAEHLRAYQRQTGELVNLVVITDGIPMYSEDSPALSEVVQVLETDPSILVHTVGFGSSQTGLQLLTSLGRGLHVYGQESAGADIARYVNDLCVTRFPWDLEGPRSAAEVRFAWDNGGQAVLPLDLNQTPLLPDGEAAGLEDPMDSTPSPDVTAAPSEAMTSAAPETTPAAADEDAIETAPPVDAPEADDCGNAIEPLVWAIPAAALALLLAAVLVWLGRKRRNRRRGGIPMRLEVFSGTPADGTGTLLYLTDELTIGRSGRCDLSWRDKDVSPQNSRIFLKGQMIYIEDLGSVCGTALGGMRLYGPNRLRSGDEISIGNVRFTLKF